MQWYLAGLSRFHPKFNTRYPIQVSFEYSGFLLDDHVVTKSDRQVSFEYSGFLLDDHVVTKSDRQVSFEYSGFLTHQVHTMAYIGANEND